MFDKIKCLLGLHDFSGGGAIWATPNFDKMSVEQKCSRCQAKKTTFMDKNTGDTEKVFVI